MYSRKSKGLNHERPNIYRWKLQSHQLHLHQSVSAGGRNPLQGLWHFASDENHPPKCQNPAVPPAVHLLQCQKRTHEMQQKSIPVSKNCLIKGRLGSLKVLFSKQKKMPPSKHGGILCPSLGPLFLDRISTTWGWMVAADPTMIVMVGPHGEASLQKNAQKCWPLNPTSFWLNMHWSNLIHRKTSLNHHFNHFCLVSHFLPWNTPAMRRFPLHSPSSSQHLPIAPLERGAKSSHGPTSPQRLWTMGWLYGGKTTNQLWNSREKHMGRFMNRKIPRKYGFDAESHETCDWKEQEIGVKHVKYGEWSNRNR